MYWFVLAKKQNARIDCWLRLYNVFGKAMEKLFKGSSFCVYVVLPENLCINASLHFTYRHVRR